MARVKNLSFGNIYQKPTKREELKQAEKQDILSTLGYQEQYQ